MFRVDSTTGIPCWPTWPAVCAARIRVNPGDRVRVEVSPYDLSRARMIYRLK